MFLVYDIFLTPRSFVLFFLLSKHSQDFATPNAADVAPVLRMLARVGFHKDVATSVVYLLEEGVATHEAFHVAIESANAAGEHTTVRALRNLYAATFDLPLDEALPKLPAATAQALIESNQSAALNSYSLYNKDPKGEALQTYNRAVQVRSRYAIYTPACIYELCIAVFNIYSIWVCIVSFS